MKKILTILLFSLLLINLFPQTGNNEFRSVWVITWEYISNNTVDVNKARIRTILDNVKAANMNAVIWQVRQAGTAYYPSSYEPWGSYAGGDDPGFDPLQYALDEAHKRGLEFHAWFNVFASGSTKEGTPANEHPEWICRDQSDIPMTSNIALSPGLPEVREYLQTVAMEIVRNYDIDGFHLDYVRWNEYTNSSILPKASDKEPLDGLISPQTISELQENAAGRYLYDYLHPYSAGVPEGFSSWPDYWRDAVTQFVSGLQDSIKSEKPWVKLSCAALGNYNWNPGWDGYNTVFQDAALWFNAGYVDQIAGMHYHWTTGTGFLGMLVNNGAQSWGYYIQPGIAAGRLYTVGPGSYILDQNNVWNNHVNIVNSIRTVDWVDGMQFFSYGTWRDRDYFEDAARLFYNHKKKIRNALPSDETVPAPQLAITKTDDYNYTLNVTPPSVDKPYWFAVYRSPDVIFKKDSSEIVAIHFSDSPFTVEQSFDGLQDYNGQYRYTVTMLNRYWKESDFSNIVNTDPIPSNAPVVVSTNPAEGAVVRLNSKIEVTFSKSINQENLQSYFSIEPAVAITDFYSDAKKVVITTSGLEYSTDYTLTVDGNLTDINGRKLDGNNDGNEGDPFYLNFSAVGQDSIGPVLLSTIPGMQDSVDLQSVISIYFNENLNPASIADNVILYRNGLLAPAHAVAYNYEEGAVINLRPEFTQNAQYTCVVKKEVTDTSGNEMTADYTFDFESRAEGYGEIVMVDNFNNAAGWEQPKYSGSTVGIDPVASTWTYSSSVYVPVFAYRRGAALKYKWDPEYNLTPRLLREYLSGGAPRAVTFDKSYILQVYVHGDGSGTLFRFALDEDYGSSTYSAHEVSQWTAVDWHGWKLVEWDLSDPYSVGEWISNDNTLNGTSYRMDSFQLTDTETSALEGVIYFDDFRIVKKTFEITSAEEDRNLPLSFNLYQNYPNPFNPSTTILFDLDKSGKVSLDIYDILGRKIKTLISEEMTAGHHQVNFDASELASGQYIYRLSSGNKQLSRMMILMK